MGNPFDQFDAASATQTANPFDQFDAPAGTAVGDPSLMDYARTNPVIGAPAHTIMNVAQGVEQLVAHAVASASDLGGNAPNSLATMLHGIADHVDALHAQSEQNYQGAKERVIKASPRPQTSEALINTGEGMGNLLNPAGMAGNTVKGFEAAAPIVNSAIRGAVSGGAFAASQPVENTDNFYTEKAKQVAAGTLAGGATGAAAEAVGGVKAPQAPATRDLKAAAKDAYTRAEAQGAVIKQDSFQSAVQDINTAATKAGIDVGLHPKATAVLNRFAKDAGLDPATLAPDVTKGAATGPISLEKMEILRRVANGALDSKDASERRIAHVVVDKLDDYMGSLKPEDIQAGNAPEAVAALNEARALYTRQAKSATIDRLVEKAKNAVGANYTAAGMDTALRQQFRALANNHAGFSRFNSDEQAAILKVVRGGPVQNTLRILGKLAPNSTFPIASELAVAGSGHGDIAAGMALGGAIAKEGAAYIGKQNVNALSELARRGASITPRPAPSNFELNPIPRLLVRKVIHP